MNKLRKIDLQKDLNSVYEMLSENQYGFSIPGFAENMTESQFQNRFVFLMRGYYHDCFVSVDTQNTPCGLFLAYDFRMYDSHCKIYSVMSSSVEEDFFGEFVHRLFVKYPLRKVFLEVGEIEKELLQTAYSYGFKQEAVMKQNRFVDGIYYNTVISGIYAEDVLGRK